MYCTMNLCIQIFIKFAGAELNCGIYGECGIYGGVECEWFYCISHFKYIDQKFNISNSDF